MRKHEIMQPWVRAKQYGWGWSWPLTWQGWSVLGVYCGLIVVGALRFASTKDPALVGGFVLLTLLLIEICWLSGERPRWRRGNQD